ncbi:hypothetical protein IFM89_018181 [Coptis chinensis]|uniref:GATA-type domain-containing protein n=1 Tax=Coptis chinensis TaxID=261450 RepID=A0A835I5T9_9MAGN|nr:hypothetical protein IFM89_018181 [Coptis chinensis]
MGVGTIGRSCLFDFNLEDLGIDEEEVNSGTFESELCVPQDPIAELEWFPNFKDDWISFNDLSIISEERSASRPTKNKEKEDYKEPRPPLVENFVRVEERKVVPTKKPRSKRIIHPAPSWSNYFSSSNAEKLFEKAYPYQAPSWSPSFSSSDCQKLSEKKFSENENTYPCAPSWSTPFSGGKVSKKRVSENEHTYYPYEKRSCTHCGVESTPQWRIGPLGPRTLCNACGVRYKSGRLLPEYRPMNSPSFDSHIHSNSHKKIVKMRGRGL